MNLKEACIIARRERKRIDDLLAKEVVVASSSSSLFFGDKTLKKEKSNVEKDCDNCGHRCSTGPGHIAPCQFCIRIMKDHWIPKEETLPEKHNNLTWWEAEKLWKEGWLIGRHADNASGYRWDFGYKNWVITEIKATDYFVMGRKDGK